MQNKAKDKHADILLLLLFRSRLLGRKPTFSRTRANSEVGGSYTEEDVFYHLYLFYFFVSQTKKYIYRNKLPGDNDTVELKPPIRPVILDFDDEREREKTEHVKKANK